MEEQIKIENEEVNNGNNDNSNGVAVTPPIVTNEIKTNPANVFISHSPNPNNATPSSLNTALPQPLSSDNAILPKNYDTTTTTNPSATVPNSAASSAPVAAPLVPAPTTQPVTIAPATAIAPTPAVKTAAPIAPTA
eukprot:11856358-Ditylum_brightwellii.AAC.1